MILLIATAFSCGDSRQSAQDDPNENTEERLEEGSGKEISPQLVPDDSLGETRHDVDTISSAGEANQQQQDSIN